MIEPQFMLRDMNQALASALGGYAAVMTIAAGYLALTAGSPAHLVRELNVERINIREPDGTLRLAISDHARIPGLIYAGHEYPHPNRPEAGMIFYNNEGSENGGLVFDGGLEAGRPANGGSLTFDRWHQDQTIQLVSTEEGQQREAALKVNDRPDQPMDISRAGAVFKMANGPARAAAFKAAGFSGVQRVYLGRTEARDSMLTLRDGAGRSRLELKVTDAGEASIHFLDARGEVTRTIASAP